MNKSEELLNMLANEAVKEDAVVLLTYILEQNKEFYDSYHHELQNLYDLSYANNSQKCIKMIYNYSIDSGKGMSLSKIY